MSDKWFKTMFRGMFVGAIIYHTVSAVGASGGDYGFAFSVFFFGLASWYFGYVEGETKEQSK